MAYSFDEDDFVLPPQPTTNIGTESFEQFINASNTANATLLNPPLPTTSNPIQIDEEVIIKNKRKPQIKLIDRLLSNKGLKHLRHDAPRSLKFKGKGHEIQDMQRLLNYYQLWMHDVFPKAKFRDCIEMTEKVGHKSNVRIMRKEWIDLTKPHPPPPTWREDGEDADALEALQSVEREQAGKVDISYELRVAVERQPESETQAREPGSGNDEPLFVEDLSDFDMDEIIRGSQEKTNREANNDPLKNDSVEENARRSPVRDEFEDEMDAMHELDDNIS